MSDAGKSGRPTVHIVDRDAAVRDGLRRLLRRYAFEVETHASAEELLAAAPVGPCAVIAEASLPGMSGLELLERLAAGVPVILIADRADVPTAVRALRAGAVDFLEKPFVDHELLRHLDRLLRPGEGAASRPASRPDAPRAG